MTQIDNSRGVTVIFDIGNVIINYDHKAVLESLSRYSEYDAVKTANLLDIDSIGTLQDYRQGGITTNEFYDRLIDLIKLKDLTFDDFVSIWCSQFDLNKDIENWILNDIIEKFNTILATDTIPIHFEYLLSTYKILGKFNKSYVSYELGMVKTNPRFFERIITENKLDCSKCIFIDDLEVNVETAIKLGINGIVFKPETIKTKFGHKLMKINLN